MRKNGIDYIYLIADNMILPFAFYGRMMMTTLSKTANDFFRSMMTPQYDVPLLSRSLYGPSYYP